MTSTTMAEAGHLAPIRSDAEHARALDAMRALWSAPDGTPEADRCAVLAMLVDAYERERHPMPPVDPVAAIGAAMAERGMRVKDLAGILGSQARASELLARRRGLTIEMIRKLGPALDIPAEILLRPYALRTGRVAGVERKRSGRAKPSPARHAAAPKAARRR